MNEDIVEKLRRERVSEHVAFVEFILRFKNRSGALFCFFEGKDDFKYYEIRVSSILQREYEFFECGGKDGVIKLKQLLDNREEYREASLAFFVDQDYLQSMVAENVFCLPAYSIENLYSTRNTLIKILNREFLLKDGDEDFEKILSSFNSLRHIFHSNTITINAWLACQAKAREELHIKTYLKIDSALGSYFSSLVSPTLDGIKDLPDLNDVSKIEDIFKDAPKVSHEKLKEQIAMFSDCDYERVFRGKFELSFIVDFLDKLKTEICKKKPQLFARRHKCSLRFECATALTTLSIYAETPQSLIDYLRTR